MPRVTPAAKAAHNARQRDRMTAYRDAAIAAYGARCACCGETERAFLAIDHIGGGGNAHRREIGGGGTRLAQWLKVNGYPEGFRVLCHNCNQATANGRECPHAKSLKSGDEAADTEGTK